MNKSVYGLLYDVVGVLRYLAVPVYTDRLVTDRHTVTMHIYRASIATRGKNQ